MKKSTKQILVGFGQVQELKEWVTGYFVEELETKEQSLHIDSLGN